MSKLTREQVLETARALFDHYGWSNPNDIEMRSKIEQMRDMALLSLREAEPVDLQAVTKQVWDACGSDAWSVRQAALEAAAKTLKSLAHPPSGVREGYEAGFAEAKEAAAELAYIYKHGTVADWLEKYPGGATVDQAIRALKPSEAP